MDANLGSKIMALLSPLTLFTLLALLTLLCKKYQECQEYHEYIPLELCKLALLNTGELKNA